MTTYKVGYFVGSLSSTSINRILSKALIRVAPDDLEFSEIPIGDLPLYSPDFDNDYPPEARALKTSIAAADAARSSSRTRGSPAFIATVACIIAVPSASRPGRRARRSRAVALPRCAGPTPPARRLRLR